MAACFAFERFVLDTRERQLKFDQRPVELNARYLDALALLVRDPGKLVSKDRFLDEVWRGVPVTDEALTQCIRTLRRQLGDDASRPRFIETVPKHGYRFIAPVEVVEPNGVVATSDSGHQWREFVVLGSAGTLGGVAAGAVGGLIYGFAAASSSVGAISVLLVLLVVTTLVAALGAAGVSFAIATSVFAKTRSWAWLVLGGAAGGLFIGAFGKLLGHDAFTLLVGRSPGDITGGLEGLLVGAAVGIGSGFALRNGSLRRSVAVTGLTGGVAGVLIFLLGGRLMFGSLELLAEAFPNSRLRLNQIAHLFGERMFGSATSAGTTILEAALFSACVVGAMVIARKRFARS
ncbi:MAG TPA: transcriptional regulator [Sphingomicrobium sp.]|nr:transcriptional regulator [Sphingomicrobium sp.]